MHARPAAAAFIPPRVTAACPVPEVELVAVACDEQRPCVSGAACGSHRTCEPLGPADTGPGRAVDNALAVPSIAVRTEPGAATVVSFRPPGR
jgi:hypothetical protein